MKINVDTKMSFFNKGLKCVIFLVLLVTVIWQYAVEIYSKFENDSTTFVSRTIDTDNFTMPPITICMDNGLKPSVLKKYGMAEIFEFLFDSREISSVWDTFVEASYLIGKDIDINIWAPFWFSNERITLKVGNMNLMTKNGKLFYIEVLEYHTSISGTCYQIKSNITMSPPNFVTLTVSFNDSVDAIDIPQVKMEYYFSNHVL